MVTRHPWIKWNKQRTTHPDVHPFPSNLAPNAPKTADRVSQNEGGKKGKERSTDAWWRGQRARGRRRGTGHTFERELGVVSEAEVEIEPARLERAKEGRARAEEVKLPTGETARGRTEGPPANRTLTRQEQRRGRRIAPTTKLDFQ
jgi:hypothetical protein